MILRYIPLVVLAALVVSAGCNKEKEKERPAVENGAPRKPEKIDNPHLDNAFKYTRTVWGGAEPDVAAAFQALKDIGIKTIVSVDGTKPNVDAAHKFGLRYVHLPFGYDGVPEETGRALAKALTEFPGPIYVHCHHGKHRSAAAIGAACVINGTLTREEAIVAMQVAGTGENYTGLWESVRRAAKLDPKELRSLNVNFVERAPIAPLADSMVEIDALFDHLKKCKDVGWRQPKDSPDLDPPHEALALREMFTEIMRKDDYKKRPDDFKKWIADSEAELNSFEAQLRAGLKSTGEEYAKGLDDSFKRVEQNCKTCHTKYRNVPQR